MKLTTLGTSHGNPTKERFNSCNTLEINENFYVIDAGVPVNSLFVRAFEHDFSKIRAVFITHMHDDHIGGLPSFIKSLIKYPQEGQYTHIFLPEDVEKPLIEWLKAMHLSGFEKWIKFHITQEGLLYKDDALEVQAIGTRHITTEDGSYITFAYRFEAEGKSLFYSGDLADDFSDFPVQDILDKGADLCVCECTHYKRDIGARVMKGLPIKQLVFNHVWDDKVTEEQARYWLSAFEEAGFVCNIAHDGDVYEI